MTIHEDSPDLLPQKVQDFEVFYTLEGVRKPCKGVVNPRTTIAEFLEVLKKDGQIEEVVEVFIEDEIDPLGHHHVLAEVLKERFAPLHIARPGLIKTKVIYQQDERHTEFRPNATIAKVLAWAVGPHGFGLHQPVSDFQLKHGDDVLSPEEHLGQVAHGQKEVCLTLVFNVKPQG